MSGVLDFIIIILIAFFSSLIASLTRGDGENIFIKVVIGTVLGTIILSILRIF